MGLPSGYKQLAYIESTGAQYVDTGFEPSNNTRVVMDTEITNGATSFLFGARVNSSANASSSSFSMPQISGTSLRSDYGSAETEIAVSPVQRLIIDKNKNSTTVNGTTVSATAQTFQCNYALTLLTVNTAGTINSTMTAAKLYSCQIYDNGTLIRDYVPCTNASGVAGLYDMVNATFSADAAGGAFTAGPFVYGPITKGDVLDFGYTGAVATVELPPCRCKLEVWGAQGGSYNEEYGVGGKGGYSVGTLTLKDYKNLHIYVGGKGGYSTDSTATVQGGGGFNGGGNAGYRGGGGGGATDIRLGSDSLYSRVIVAGGGGGAHSYSSSYYANGGAGGGENGADGSYDSASYASFIGHGATQTEGGAIGTGSSEDYNGEAGSFGVGGNTGKKTSSSSYYSNGAGGGGWYGGGAAGNYSGGSNARAGGGGGGSGFVWVGENAPDGYLLNENYYLTSASTVAGGESITDPDGSSVTGHAGNGYARITILELIGLQAPADFEVSAKDTDAISLSWSAVDGAVGYILRRNGLQIGTTEETSYTDNTAKPYREYTYAVAAYDEDVESRAAELQASVLEPDGFLTVDRRTAADVERVKILQNIIKDGKATDAELSEWLDGPIGAYNAWDMNRVESAVDYIQKYLNGLQYELDRYRAERRVMSDPFWNVPWDVYDLITKKDWVLENIPSESDLARYLSNVDALTEAIAISKKLPADMNHLDYIGANEIERVLRKEYDEAVAYEINTKQLIDNTKAAIIFSNEIYGGEFGER